MISNTVFVLLAGGKSERMGVDKGLLKFKEDYWILEQLNSISKSNIEEVYIGLGFNAQHYFDAIPWLKKALINFVDYNTLKVKVFINENPELGSFSTLQTVLKKIPSNFDILLNNIDIPILNASELDKIIETKNDVVLPYFEGENGHPIKMSYTFWNNLLELDLSDKNSRLDVQLKKINPIKISKIEVFDRAITLNLNTQNDWISFLESSKK